MTCRNCAPAGIAAVTGDSSEPMADSVLATIRIDK